MQAGVCAIGSGTIGTMTEKKSWWRDAKSKIESQVDSKRAQAAEGAAAAGSLVIEKDFGMSTVAIYDGGFVRVSKMMTPFTPYEKLKSIKFTHHTRDQSPGGRAVASALTLGLSTFTSPEDQKLSLTIVTDKKVHTLSDPAGSGGDMKKGLALEAAGQAILDAASPSSAAPPPPPTSPDLADQIRKLADLHAAGILTDDEFAAKKQQILDRM